MLQKHPISVLTGFDLKDGFAMPRIPEPQIERLKAEVSLVRLIEGAGHVLVRQGKDLALRCPLHASRSFTPFLSAEPLAKFQRNSRTPAA